MMCNVYKQLLADEGCWCFYFWCMIFVKQIESEGFCTTHHGIHKICIVQTLVFSFVMKISIFFLMASLSVVVSVFKESCLFLYLIILASEFNYIEFTEGLSLWNQCCFFLLQNICVHHLLYVIINVVDLVWTRCGFYLVLPICVILLYYLTCTVKYHSSSRYRIARVRCGALTTSDIS